MRLAGLATLRRDRASPVLGHRRKSPILDAHLIPSIHDAVLRPLSSGRVVSAARTHAEDSIATPSRSILPPSRDALRFEPRFVARRTCSDPGISVEFVDVLQSPSGMANAAAGAPAIRSAERTMARDIDPPSDRVNTATARSRRGRRRAPDRRQKGRRIVGQKRPASPYACGPTRHRRDPRVSRSTAGGTHVHALVLSTNASRPLAGIGGPPRVVKEALPCARRACRRQAGHTRSAEYRRDNPLRITSRRREPRGEAP